MIVCVCVQNYADHVQLTVWEMSVISKGGWSVPDLTSCKTAVATALNKWAWEKSTKCNKI